MSRYSELKENQKTQSATSRYSQLRADTTEEEDKPDVSSVEGLRQLAKEAGLEIKEPKKSLFKRGVDLISRANYASAGFAKAVIRKDENPIIEAWKGLSGKEKETYSDVLEELGVENRWIKGGAGFALDVLLDPTTYFGGAIVKGGLKGVGVVGRTGLSVGKTFSPQTVGHLEAAGKSLQDALGTAFVHGYGTTAGVADDVGRYFNKVGMAKEEVIEENVKRFGKFKKEDMAEAGELMMTNRRLELKARKGESVRYLKSKNDRVNKLVTVMKAKGKELAEKAGLDSDEAYANYIPFLNKETMDKALSSAIKVGPKGYLKEFRDKLPDAKLLKKPIEAYSRREYEIVRDTLASETLTDMVTAYGKKFKNAAEALEEGYKPIYKRGFKELGVYPAETAAGKTVAALGKSKKPIGYLLAKDAKFINDYMFPEFKTIDHLARATGFDTFTRWFKTAVTSWFPAFHIRNYISGNVQNYQVIGAQAFNPANHNASLAVLKGVDRELVLGGKIYKTKDLNRALKENFRGASRYISDIGEYIEELAGNKFVMKKIKDPGKRLGNVIEMNQKSVAMIGSLRQGKTLETALLNAKKAGFDYTKITKFEQKIIRRAIPFYSFARFNAELQVRTMVKNPERILNQIKFTRNLSEIFGGRKPSEEDLKGIPPWALSGLGFKVEGNRYLTKFGLPLEEFVERINKPLSSSLSSMNPIIKYPLESKMGYDFFREKKLVDINKIAPVTGEIIMSDKTPDSIKQIFNVTKKTGDDGKVRYYASPKTMHKLRNLPTARLQNTLEKMFDEDMDKVDKWLAFLTGARIYDIDVELQQYFSERDLKRDIEDQLINKNIGRQYQSFYIPKGN